MGAPPGMGRWRPGHCECFTLTSSSSARNVRPRRQSSSWHAAGELSTVRQAWRLPWELPASSEHAQHQLFRSCNSTRYFRPKQAVGTARRGFQPKRKQRRAEICAAWFRCWSGHGSTTASYEGEHDAASTTYEGRNRANHLRRRYHGGIGGGRRCRADSTVCRQSKTMDARNGCGQ